MSEMRINQTDAAWLAGLLEGEGCFWSKRREHARCTRQVPSLKLQMCDRDVVERVANLVGAKVTTLRPQREHWLRTYIVKMEGHPALEVMRAVRPYMGWRRGQKIDELLSSTYAREVRVA